MNAYSSDVVMRWPTADIKIFVFGYENSKFYFQSFLKADISFKVDRKIVRTVLKGQGFF